LKLNYTKPEVEKIKNNVFFTEDEEQILKYWLLDYSMTKIADIMKLSTSTISRRKKNILNKIDKAKSDIL